MSDAKAARFVGTAPATARSVETPDRSTDALDLADAIAETAAPVTEAFFDKLRAKLLAQTSSTSHAQYVIGVLDTASRALLDFEISTAPRGPHPDRVAHEAVGALREDIEVVRRGLNLRLHPSPAADSDDVLERYVLRVSR